MTQTARLVLMLCLWATLWSSLCQANNAAGVLSAAGGWATDGKRVTLSTVGQPTPVGLVSHRGGVNYAGFLQTFLMHPSFDADNDGFSDEDDPDDDNNGLRDHVELSGRGFEPPTLTDPFLVDSDGDGAGDGAESGAGTNPQDGDSLLRIASVRADGPSQIITWESRGGESYRLLCATNVMRLALAPEVAAVASATGGEPPWYKTWTSATNSPTGPAVFYRVAKVEK